MPSLSTTTGLIDLRIEEKFAQSETLFFTIKASDPRAALLGEDMEIRWRGRVFYVFEPRKFRGRDGAALIEYECPALWARLADRKRIGTLELFGLTIAAGLDLILDGTGWTGSITDDVDEVTTWYLNSNDATVLDLVRKWAKITGTEVAFDTLARTVSLRQQIGANRGVGFRYARNVETIERRSNPPAVTRLFPFGRDDLGISGVEPDGLPYVEDFSFYTAQGLTEDEARARYLREEIWTDTSFTTDADLYAGALARLAVRAAPMVNYEMKVVDLAELSGLAADVYALGDTVRVYDGELGFNVQTRVVRLEQHPLEPWRSTVELSYLPPFVPDPSVGSSRTDPGAEWVLFESSSQGERQVREGSTILARLDLTTIPGAEWIVGYSINGIGVGTGTVTLTPTDDVSDLPLVAPVTLDVADGVPFHWSFTLGDRQVVAAQHSLVVRGVSSGAGIGVDISGDAPDGTALWVLAKGTTGRTVALPNSERFEYTGAVQYFTVPDDVSQVTIECVGASGGLERAVVEECAGGGSVTATFPVVAGATYEVYVGGFPGINNPGFSGGWPDGGNGDTVAGANGVGGGGSSRVCALGETSLANFLIIAPGGGGSGQQFTGHRQRGGDGGFYNGADGFLGPTEGGVAPGGGATQSAGGVGTAGGGNGSLGQGGVAADATNSFTFPPGGGGGGYYGGAGGGTNNASGAGNGGGGGGGSGMISPSGFDLLTQDGANKNAHGYVVFSWETPII